MKINIGVSEKNLKGSTTILEKLLANEMVVYIKIRKSHWNVAGESFMELHKLFENQYKALEEFIDGIAERIGKLGQPAIGTMREFTKLATIQENPGNYPPSKEIIKELLKDHETIIVQLRKDIEESADKNKDAGTADFLTGIMEQHETMAWILRKYLQ
jgi:starvation-inducible DNA-binding protein